MSLRFANATQKVFAFDCQLLQRKTITMIFRVHWNSRNVLSGSIDNMEGMGY